MPLKESYLEDDPLWYKDSIIYELHIKAFYDSDDNGIGDFKGLTQKLDYLRDLGITTIWLLPFYPSPLKDDGYDIAGYFDVHPDYGTLKDFKEFLKEAHSRGLRVITELVLNHTSDQHPWFQKARRSKPGSAARNFYVWSDTPEKYKDARIIFQDFEHSNWTYDPVAKAYFWHRFYSHQPDLNFDNPQVRKAMFRVIDYWMGLGVDGVRLDAVPYLFEREGTNCENLPETYEYLKQLRRHVDEKFKNRMLLAEANQWPEDAVAYFGHGDACNMAFHFPLMPRMFMSIQMEDRFPIIDILDQTPSIPENCQWSLFLRNHDELTLEMVTDEERDYMYRIYAKDPKTRINLGIRRRLAPLLGNDMRKMRLMYVLLFSLPGTPVVYYGNELGMGDNYYLGDRDGVRTPMQWSSDQNAGFSRSNPQQLYLPVIADPEYHYTTINVRNQERNNNSFLWWMRHLIAMRKRHKAFGRGTLNLLHPDNSKIFAFIREYESEKILVVVNLSRHTQMTKLDLGAYSGLIPEEVFSKNKFMPIRGDSPYVLTFAPYEWYIFTLQQTHGMACVGLSGGAVALDVAHAWEGVLEGRAREEFTQEVLPAYLSGCRWFGGKARQVQDIRILESVPVGKGSEQVQLLLMEVDYLEGLSDKYVLPLAFASGEEADSVLRDLPQAVISRLNVDGRPGILYDGIYNEAFCKRLIRMIARHRRVKGRRGELVAHLGKGFSEAARGREYLLKPQVLKAEQSNTSVLYGNDFFLKIFRHPDEGKNPDLEISQFLTERAGFLYSPSFAGSIEYRRNGAEPITIAILQNYVPNQGDAFSYYIEVLKRYYDRVLGWREEIEGLMHTPPGLLDESYRDVTGELREVLTGAPLERAALLGQRTAELHMALLTDRDDPNFTAERISTLWQRSVYQSMQSLTKRVLQMLRRNLGSLDQSLRGRVEEILSLEPSIVERQKAYLKKKLSVLKIRHHGDYHLGQVLFTGKDFVIIDFEGEPARSLGERRLKKSALRDVAGMIRSFHYAAYLALLKEAPIRPEDRPSLEPWADLWYHYVAGSFLRSYLDAVAGTELVPETREDLEIMLDAFLLEKAIYELGYELNNRPEWLIIPIRGIMHILDRIKGDQ